MLFLDNNFYELILIFFIGLALLYVTAFFLKIKRKTLLLLTLNSILGAIIYYALTKMLDITALSPGINTFICGYAGIAACILILALNLAL